jgi:hypothetical protein
MTLAHLHALLLIVFAWGDEICTACTCMTRSMAAVVPRRAVACWATCASIAASASGMCMTLALAKAMDDMRDHTGKPVSTTEVIETYIMKKALIEWSDFLNS